MRAPNGPDVDQIMSRDVLRVDISDTLAEARLKMAGTRIRKVVVLRGNEPIGIMEDWLAERLEQKLNAPNTTIENALAQFQINTAPVRQVPSGTLVESVKDDFASYAAVLVLDADRQLKGIVTASDLDKLWERV